MFLKQITDRALAQNAYLIGCQKTGEAILIDPERDVDRYEKIARENDLKIVAVAETHIHADFLGGTREFLEKGAKAYLSALGGKDWQYEWAKKAKRVSFLKDGSVIRIGGVEIRAVATEGHTPEHLSFLVTDLGGGADEPIALVSGDFIFVGDVGRPDLLKSAAGVKDQMKESAKRLYASLRQTKNLAAYLQILPGHGAGSACGKSLGAIPHGTLGYERKFNDALKTALHKSESAFVEEILSDQPEPPLYFARMKRDNRAGPPLLPKGKLPSPKKLAAGDLDRWLGRRGHAVLDLRKSATEFLAGHLPGAVFAGFAKHKLPDAAGSYLDERQRILLVAEEEAQVDEAVRQLVRIGLDHIPSWIPAGLAHAAKERRSKIRSIEASGLAQDLKRHPQAAVLDVRGVGEFKKGRVRGAVQIAHTRLAVRLEEIPAGRPLYVHCASGLRAAMAASFLAGKGIEVVHVNGDFEEIPVSLRE